MKKLFFTILFVSAACAHIAAQTLSQTLAQTREKAGNAAPPAHALRQKTCEQLAAGLQESGRAYVVGNTTAGDDMDAELEELPGGAYLIYAAGQPRTPKGTVVEGRGVIPDLEVNLTRAGLLRGEDAQLDAAIKYIEGRTAAKGNN